MVHTYLIDEDGGIYAKADETEGVTLEIDMHPGDNLPAHAIPCPERRYQLEHSEWECTREWEKRVGAPIGLFSGPELRREYPVMAWGQA